MTDMQSLDPRALSWLPETNTRNAIHEWFLAIEFRAYTLLYVAYAVGIGVLWLRDFRAGRVFRDPLLAAVVVWGAVYFTRAFGRSDGPHLYSALPPICLLLAHAGSVGLRAWKRGDVRPVGRPAWALGGVVLAAWIFLMGSGASPNWKSGSGGWTRFLLREASPIGISRLKIAAAVTLYGSAATSRSTESCAPMRWPQVARHILRA
jgi:hypothetical protein